VVAVDSNLHPSGALFLWSMLHEPVITSVAQASLTKNELAMSLGDIAIGGLTILADSALNDKAAAHASQRRELTSPRKRKLTGNSCHPRETTLDVEDVGNMRIDRVSVGDRVRGLHGYEPVTGFMHAETDRSMKYYRFYTRSASVAISDTHWLFVNGRETDPATVVVGDALQIAVKSGRFTIERVERIAREVMRGAFHVQVASGAYYADGILCSTYIAHVPLAAWKLFADTYAWARYKVGVPLTPEGQGPMSIFWPLHAYEALGLPTSTARTVWPVTMTATLFAEVFNTIWVHASKWSGTTACLAIAVQLGAQLKKKKI
jgi:hypothetical protein